MLKARSKMIFLAILGMEMCWLYILFNAANKSVADKLSIPILMTMLLISLVISWAFRYLHWPKPIPTVLAWLIWPAVMLLMIKIQIFPQNSPANTSWLTAIPQALVHVFDNLHPVFEPVLLILLSSALLWWIGRRLAYIKASFTLTVAEFQFGLVMLLLIFFSTYELNLDQSASIPAIITFFFLSLMGISISHTEENTTWYSGHWSVLVLISVGIILVLGFLISLIITPGLLHWCLQALQWFWGQIERLVSLIANLFPWQNSANPPPPVTGPAAGAESNDNNVFHLPELLRRILSVGWLILVAGLLLGAIWRITSQIYNWMRQRTKNSGAEIESLKSSFKTDFVNWLKLVLSKVFRIRFRSATMRTPRVISSETTSVRQVYRQLLRWGATKGYPRLPSQTPNEYHLVLNQAFMEAQPDLDYITHEYLKARYGPQPPTTDQANQLKIRWQNLKQKKLRGGKHQF